jgi:uncharacterized membrane protein
MTLYRETAVATTWPKTLMWAFFATPDGAAKAHRTLRDAGQTSLVSVESTAVVQKDATGVITVNERPKLSGGQGLCVGLLLGGLLGVLFPSTDVAAGAAVLGTTAGPASQVHDAGFPDQPLQTAAVQMPPQSSALFALASRDWVEYMSSHQALHNVARYLESVASAWGTLPISEQLAEVLRWRSSDPDARS